MTITNEVFSHYLLCPYRAHLDLHGKPGSISEYELTMAQLSNEFRPLAMKTLLTQHGQTPTPQAPPQPSRIYRLVPQ